LCQQSYLICLTIGPAFLSASIYLCLSRIVHIYSTLASRLRPKHYTYLFVSCDLVSLILQGAGGGIAATAGPTDQNQVNLGTNIMIAGLSFQVFSLLLFMILCVDFALRIRKVPGSQRNENYQSLRSTRWFKGFLIGMLTSLSVTHDFSITANPIFRKQLSVAQFCSSPLDAAIESQSSNLALVEPWPIMKSSLRSWKGQ
jgi:hypothetical protein